MTKATIRTRHDQPAVVAAAIKPDNTSEMATTVDGELVVTVIERETARGLRTTIDDYVSNLTVAADTITTLPTNDSES